VRDRFIFSQMFAFCEIHISDRLLAMGLLVNEVLDSNLAADVEHLS